ncbi:hypothetical protein BGW39_011184 [Mortierella sp. 14UC]|nr:hypothetical protein BGW39_011184 [Mortierella sp. 14UC]
MYPPDSPLKLNLKMRASILLIATAVLVAVKAAPILAEPEALAGTASRCYIVDGEWECPIDPGKTLAPVEPEALAGTASRCYIVDGEWECPIDPGKTLAPIADAAAASVEPEALADTASRCHIIEGEWQCPIDPRIPLVDAATN